MPLPHRIFATLLLLATCAVHAETLHGIAPLSSLGDIKKMYPNATFTRVKAAWVTEGQDFFSMQGPGFPGVLYIGFGDSRPDFRRQLAEAASKPSGEGENTEPYLEFIRKMANRDDDEALDVRWVRWVPVEPIPLARYKSKYGEPKCDFSASDMAPYCQWASRGLLVNVTENQQRVISVEAQFTKAELREAWHAKYKFVPDFLKEPSESRAAPSRKRE